MYFKWKSYNRREIRPKLPLVDILLKAKRLISKTMHLYHVAKMLILTLSGDAVIDENLK